MFSQSRSASVGAVVVVADRIERIKRESRRDLAGVAVAVTIGGLLWFVTLALASVLG